MLFTTDSYIEIGNSHNICEDYALHGIFNGIPYIIISDGCSSSKTTDFGSRILAHGCQSTLIRFSYIVEKLCSEALLRNIKQTSMDILEKLYLNYDVCDATLLYAFISQNKLFIHGYGDGNIIINKKTPVNNSIYLDNLHYDTNAPFYISYRMDSLRKKGYLESEYFGKGCFNINSYSLDNTIPEKKSFKCDTPYYLELDVADINSITLTSDGIESYSHSNKRLCINPKPSEEEVKSLNFLSMVKRIVSYKNYNGEFVKRRMKKIKEEIGKIQGEHYDDVSCATIWINHEQS